MIKINRFNDSPLLLNNSFILRVPKSMLQYPTLTSKDLLVHIDTITIEEIQLKYGLSCNKIFSDQNSNSEFIKIFVKPLVNFNVSLLRKNNCNSLNDNNILICENFKIYIDYTEFCVKNSVSPLTIYDFIAKLYVNKDILSPIDEDENYYIYEVNIIGETFLAPNILINTSHSSTLEELNKKLNKNFSNYEFTRGELASLTSLFLSDNPQFDFDLLSNFVNLNKLYLWYNYFKTIPKNFSNICFLSNLRILNLERNNLDSLPYEFGNLLNLEEIDLCINNLCTLPLSIGKLKKLKSLTLYENKLTELPSTIGDLSSLELGNFRQNFLTTLPESFSMLVNLKELNFNDNEIYTLSDDFYKLENLETLFLANNDISYLPKDFCKLPKLKFLDLSYNNLFDVDLEICNLKNLSSLTLSGNNLSYLPKNFNNLAYLKYLFLDDNNFSIVPCELNNFNYLEILCLDKNNISNLSAFPDKNFNVVSIENQTIIHSDLSLTNDHYILNLKFLRDFHNKLPKILNISNLGYLDSTFDDDYIIWPSWEENNTVSFEFHSKDSFRNYSFSGKVILNLK